MANIKRNGEINISVCRICLDSKCPDMVTLSDLNGWLTLFQYCFGIPLTMQDEPRVICKNCADNVKSYAKFKDLCEKSDILWKSMTADEKCKIPKFTVKVEEDILKSIEQNLEPTNELTNKNESFDMTHDNDSNILNTDSNVECLFNEIKAESDIQSNEKDTTNKTNIGNVSEINSSIQQNALEVIINEVDIKKSDVNIEYNDIDIENNDKDIENICEIDSSNIQKEDSKQKSSEDVKNQFSRISIKSDTKKFYKCKKCEKKYTREKWYQTHIQVCKSSNHRSHRNGVENGRILDSGNIVTNNNGVSISKNVYQSDKCIKENSNINENQDKLLFCGLCKYNCTRFDNLCKHLDEHWSNNDLVCKLCEFVGEDLAAITIHRFSHFPTKSRARFLCHICQQMKKSTLSLHFHYRIVHLKKSGGFCLRCNKEFKRFKAWRVHERAHVIPGYICDICGKNFVYKYMIKDHLMNHTKQAQHICDVCGKSYTRATYLRLHIESVHVTSGPLKCTHCNRLFKSQHTLSLHQKILAREKPYKCEICFKGYHTPTYLKKHMVTHSDERPHCCDVCGSRYKAKCLLNVHMRKHTGIMPFKCVTCSKEFATSGQLKIHSSVHTGVRPHRCKHCTRSFNYKKLLLAHCALQHKNEIAKNSD